MADEKNMNDTLLVGLDISHGKDVGVLIVGRRRPNESVQIINAFQGEDALRLYNELVTKKEVQHV